MDLEVVSFKTVHDEKMMIMIIHSAESIIQTHKTETNYLFQNTPKCSIGNFVTAGHHYTIFPLFYKHPLQLLYSYNVTQLFVVLFSSVFMQVKYNKG